MEEVDRSTFVRVVADIVPDVVVRVDEAAAAWLVRQEDGTAEAAPTRA